jgi:SAM-dependent methyltransferase
LILRRVGTLIERRRVRHYGDAALKALTLGREDQSFLDARWVAALLRVAPSRSRRRLALSVLSISPHYFYRRPEYEGLWHAEFTEREFERNRATREKLGQLVLGPYLDARQVVLGYGCGPGFLVRYVANAAKTVYGVDISRGAIECARVINGAPNASFLQTANLAEIGDATIDLAYSIAVAQHLTDSMLECVLKTTDGSSNPQAGSCFTSSSTRRAGGPKRSGDATSR